MNIFSLILCVLAFAVFIAAHLAVPRKWATVPLGLALATSGLVLHFLISTEHLVLIHWN